ncbi:structure-specific endonuclease subunit slx4, partial [Plakobranchus ocellatus]
VAPEPQAGFRQPSTTGLPTPCDVGDSGAGGLDMMDITTCPASTPMPEEISDTVHERAHLSSPFASRTLAVRENVSGEGRLKQARCSSAGILDWRGRIQPETLRYKWSKTKFGGHTYLKKWYRPNLRSAGSSAGRKRPKTAPSTTKERWKTEKVKKI